MKILLDTNIILDILLIREPFHTQASQIIQLADKDDFDLYVTASMITDLIYILSKQLGNKKSRQVVKQLCSFVSICNVDESIILNAINSNFKDFEDAVQYFSAKANNLDAIITRNKKDYKSSEIKVFTPEQFIKQIKKNSPDFIRG